MLKVLSRLSLPLATNESIVVGIVRTDCLRAMFNLFNFAAACLLHTNSTKGTPPLRLGSSQSSPYSNESNPTVSLFKQAAGRLCVYLKNNLINEAMHEITVSKEVE